MPNEPGWFARILDYLLAIGIFWWAGLAVFTALERYAERLFPTFWKARIDPWFTPMRRKQGLVLFAILAFLIGNFRAFDEQSQISRNAVVELVRVQEERDAAKTQASERQKEIDRLSSQIAFLQSRSIPPQSSVTRNPDGLYQLGDEVASVSGVLMNQGNSLITFQVVRSTGKLDATREVEYRDFVLSCAGLPPAPAPNVVAGMVISMSTGVQCKILRKR